MFLFSDLSDSFVCLLWQIHFCWNLEIAMFVGSVIQRFDCAFFFLNLKFRYYFTSHLTTRLKAGGLCLRRKSTKVRFFILTAKFVVDCVLISLCGLVRCRSQ